MNLSAIGGAGAGTSEKINMHQKIKKNVSEKIPIKTRRTVTADTGITGKNATRYRALKKAINQGSVKRSIASIKKFKHGGRGMGTDTARKYLEAIKKDL